MEALHQTDLERMRPVLARYGLEGTAVFPVSSKCRDCTGYKVATNAGDIFLKEIPKQQVGLESLERRLQQLQTYRYSAMPHYYTTPAERFVTVFGMKKYIVANWVDGESLFLVPTKDNYRQLGRNLALLHHIPAPAHPRIKFRNEMRVLSRLGNHGRDLLRSPQAHKLLTSAVKNPVLTHADLRSQNIIADNNRVVLVSWDKVQPGCSYVDVAQGLMMATDYDIYAMQALLGGYEEVKPLAQEEKQLIFGFFSFPHNSRHIMRKAERTQPLKVYDQSRNSPAHRQEILEWLELWSGW